MTDHEPEDNRGLLQETTNDQEHTGGERNEAADDPNIKQIVSSLNQVAEQLRSQGDETHPKNKSERFWKYAEVFGLWAAAAVGVTAVIVANHDAADQRTTMDKQLTVMQRQLDEMRAERRAWLDITVAPDSLVFDAKSGNATLNFMYRFKNVGRSVAQNIEFAGVPTVNGKELTFPAIFREQEKACQNAIQNKATEFTRIWNMGSRLFPNDSFPAADRWMNGSVQISADEIERGVSAISSGTMADRFRLAFVGCVYYRLSAGEDFHQTGFVVDVVRLGMSTDGKTPLPFLLKVGESISNPDLAFMRVFGDGKID